MAAGSANPANPAEAAGALAAAEAAGTVNARRSEQSEVHESGSGCTSVAHMYPLSVNLLARSGHLILVAHKLRVNERSDAS